MELLSILHIFFFIRRRFIKMSMSFFRNILISIPYLGGGEEGGYKYDVFVVVKLVYINSRLFHHWLKYVRSKINLDVIGMLMFHQIVVDIDVGGRWDINQHDFENKTGIHRLFSNCFNFRCKLSLYRNLLEISAIVIVPNIILGLNTCWKRFELLASQNEYSVNLCYEPCKCAGIASCGIFRNSDGSGRRLSVLKKFISPKSHLYTATVSACNTFWIFTLKFRY